MSLEAKKQERESSQNLIRRFTQRIKKSGVLLKARSSRFHKRAKSRQMKKRTAIRREKLKEEYKKLEKLGTPKK